MYISLGISVIIICIIIFYLLNLRSNNISLKTNVHNKSVVEPDQHWELREINYPIKSKGKEIEINNELNSTIKDILKQSKSNMNKVNKGKQLFEISFSPDIHNGLKNGSYSLMNSKEAIGAKRAMAVDNSGNVVGHGNITKYKNAKGLAVNALTMAVSQEHLQEIRKDIATVKEELKTLNRIQLDKHYAIAEGAYDYFQKVITHVQEEGKIEQKLQIQLEQIFVQSLQSIRELITISSETMRKIENLDTTVYINTKKQYESLKELADNFECIQTYQHLHFRNLMIYVKLCEFTSESDNVLNTNLNSINNLIDENYKTANNVISYGEYISKNFKAKLRTQKHVSKLKNDMSNVIKKLNSVTPRQEMIHKGPPEIPRKMLIEMDDGEVQSMVRIEG